MLSIIVINKYILVSKSIYLFIAVVYTR